MDQIIFCSQNLVYQEMIKNAKNPLLYAINAALKAEPAEASEKNGKKIQHGQTKSEWQKDLIAGDCSFEPFSKIDSWIEID